MIDLRQKNFYERLGVRRDASTEDIRDAYVALARIYHPDSHFYDGLLTDEQRAVKPEHLAAMSLITEAYNVLVDEEQRARYDKTLPTETTAWKEPYSKKHEQEQKLNEKKEKRAKTATFNNFSMFNELEVVDDETAAGEKAVVSVAEMLEKQRQSARATAVTNLRQKQFIFLLAAIVFAVIAIAVWRLK